MSLGASTCTPQIRSSLQTSSCAGVATPKSRNLTFAQGEIQLRGAMSTKGESKARTVFDWRAQASDHAPASAFEVAEKVASTLFKAIPGSSAPAVVKRTYKVTVVGVGNVGMACAQTILTQDLCDEIALVDVVEEKLKGEMLDLQHAAAFLPRATILANTDYKVTEGSDICIVTAGARQREGESRLALVEKNVSLSEKIIPQLVMHSPETTLLIISNPVDARRVQALRPPAQPRHRVRHKPGLLPVPLAARGSPRCERAERSRLHCGRARFLSFSSCVRVSPNSESALNSVTLE